MKNKTTEVDRSRPRIWHSSEIGCWKRFVLNGQSLGVCSSRSPANDSFEHYICHIAGDMFVEVSQVTGGYQLAWAGAMIADNSQAYEPFTQEEIQSFVRILNVICPG